MKHPIRRMLLCLLLGLVTTITIAWTHAVFVDAMPIELMREYERGVTSNDFPHWSMTICRRWGSTVVMLRPIDGLTPQAPQVLAASPTSQQVAAWVEASTRFQQGLPPLKTEPKPIVDPPRWSRSSEHSVSTHDLRTEDARGWPFRALMSFTDHQFNPQTKARTSVGSWRLDFGDQQGPMGLQHGLPLRPITLGLLADTLLFGMIWFTLLFGARAARRQLRRKRGRCPMCGYDLRYHHSPSGAGGSRYHHSPSGANVSPVDAVGRAPEQHHSENGGTCGEHNHSESGGACGCPECGWGRGNAET